MTTLTAVCGHCRHTRTVAAPLVTVHLDLAGRRHFATWTCPCGGRAVTPLPGKHVNPLRDAGAMCRPFRLPDEINDVRRARVDPLTEDEFLAFGLALERLTTVVVA